MDFVKPTSTKIFSHVQQPNYMTSLVWTLIRYSIKFLSMNYLTISQYTKGLKSVSGRGNRGWSLFFQFLLFIHILVRFLSFTPQISFFPLPNPFIPCHIPSSLSTSSLRSSYSCFLHDSSHFCLMFVTVLPKFLKSHPCYSNFHFSLSETSGSLTYLMSCALTFLSIFSLFKFSSFLLPKPWKNLELNSLNQGYPPKLRY